MEMNDIHARFWVIRVKDRAGVWQYVSDIHPLCDGSYCVYWVRDILRAKRWYTENGAKLALPRAHRCIGGNAEAEVQEWERLPKGWCGHEG